jgi:hypothetical protein
MMAFPRISNEPGMRALASAPPNRAAYGGITELKLVARRTAAAAAQAPGN